MHDPTRMWWGPATILAGILVIAGCNDTTLGGDADAGADPGTEATPDTLLDPVPDAIHDSIPLDAVDVEETTDPSGDVAEEDASIPPYDPPPTCDWFEARVYWPTGAPVHHHEADSLFPSGAEPIVHVIAVGGSSSGEGGIVEVTVEKTYRPVILVLASEGSVSWSLVREEGASIAQILMFGDEPGTISGASGTPLLDRSGSTSFGWDPCWPMCDPHSVGGWNLAMQAEIWTGEEVSTFTGAENASQVVIRHLCHEECDALVVCEDRECGEVDGCRAYCGTCPDGLACLDGRCAACTPDCAGRTCGSDGCDGSCGTCGHARQCVGGTCVDRDLFPGCPDVTSESLYCFTILDGGGPALVGLDSGSVCTPGSTPEYLMEVYESPNSMGYSDGHLFLCGYGGMPGLLRISLVDHTWDLAPTLCDAVSIYESGPLVITPHGEEPDKRLLWFPTFEDALDDTPTVIPGRFFFYRMAVVGDVAYMTLHSADRLKAYDLPSGTELPDVPLEGFDDQVKGLTATEDGRVVLSWEEGILVFDATSGERLDEIPVSPYPLGLVCWTDP